MLAKIFTIVIYLLAASLCFFIVVQANSAAATSTILDSRLAPVEKVSSTVRSLFGHASFGLYQGAARESAELDELVAAYQHHRRNTQLASLGLIALTLVLLVLQVRKRKEELRNGLAKHLLGTSLLFLVIGLITPIFSLVVSQDLPILDEVVLKHDSKSVISTIITLFSANQLFVAVLLITFSVLIPVLKTVLTFWVLTGRRGADAIARIVKSLGKWSMADVFVVALLLAVFSLSSDGLTDARVGVGLYYFAGYVLLSLLAAQLMVNTKSVDSTVPARY